MSKTWVAILLGGLAAAGLDILYAFAIYGPLSYGLSPIQVLQSVAAGWIGREAAMADGVSTAALGALTHFGIATIMAMVFVFFSGRIRALRTNAILWGVLYGLVLYVAMNYVVAPLSAASAAGHFAASSDEAVERLSASFSMLRPAYDEDYPWMIHATIFTHTILVGVPIALIARSAGKPRIDVA